METDKRTTLTLGLKKKLKNRHSQNEQPSQTASDKRAKLTIGLKKKPQITQAQAESQMAFDKRQPHSLGLRKKTALTQPQTERKAQTATERHSRFGTGPMKTPEFTQKSVLDRPQRPPMPRSSSIRMPKTLGNNQA